MSRNNQRNSETTSREGKKIKEFLFIVTEGELERIQSPSRYKYCVEINVRRQIS